MSKDRSMATGPYPTRVVKRPVVIEGSWSGGSYRTHIAGHFLLIVLSDGTEVPCCNQPHGHKKQATMVACANRAVAALNDAAGIPEAAR